MRRVAFVAITAVAIGLSGVAKSDPLNSTLSGASPGGLWSVVGAGIDAAVASGIPGSSITYQTSSGGLANAAMVATKRVPMAIIGDMELNAAVKGKGPFADKPLEGLRVLFRAYDGPKSRYQMFQPIINADFAGSNGIKTFDDIIAKKTPIHVGFNRIGNMDADIAMELMSAMGLTPEMVKANGGDVIHASSSELAELMKDRRIDLVFAGYSFNHASVRDMASAISLKMLPVSEAAARKVAENNAAALCETTAGEYEWSDVDLVTVCVGALVVANETLPEETAYRLTDAVIANIGSFQKTHRALKKVTPQIMAVEAAAPFHPGALRAFREHGIAD